ncbi:hypothetical protein GCM10010156_75140 [Planobispora rosea]|uniref:Uncharacterized protein n=1 Tax=Planobispora rosea TaxID=35762 RepID=A0A8J3WH20_PLARO|nr:hypothetical protein [Planobispora rosea]GGT06736.1 hypothetical protein GCM10010156_75140 [Planobispora rosea]GIH89090.1 hypothetical protein Pro02_74980 [Planobispora rosea]
MSKREELRQVEADLERLRAEVASIRDQLTDLGPADAVERSQMINMADEQQALIVGLEARRDTLLRSLDDA